MKIILLLAFEQLLTSFGSKTSIYFLSAPHVGPAIKCTAEVRMENLKGYGDYLFPHLHVHFCAFTLHLCVITKVWWGPEDGWVKLNSIITTVSNVRSTKKGIEELILLKCFETWLLISRANALFFCCAVKRVRTPSGPGSALQPQGPLLADKYSPEVNLYAFLFHLPREIPARSLVKPHPPALSPALWMKEVSPDPKLQNVQRSFWTRHFRKASRATREYLSPLPLPTVTEPLIELTSRGVN